MRAEEEVCRYRRGGVELLAAFLSRYVGDPHRLLAGFEVVRVEHGEGYELLLVPQGVYGIIEGHCSRVYTAGLHVAAVRRGRLLPTLSLGQFAEHAIVDCFVVLPERLVAKLTYGRSLVLDPRGLRARIRRGCQPLAVLDARGRFVAWVRVEREADKLLIKPLVDVGWYLRSGV